MKMTELRKKNDEDLQKTESELREEVRLLRFKVASREVKNHRMLRRAKKDVARVLTILKERAK